MVETLPFEYAINTAGYRDPTMHWVRVNLRGSAPGGQPVAYGYSDGEDAGPGFECPKVSYRWGRNLALDRAYTASRASSKNSGNEDTGGRELTNGKVIAPTDSATTSEVQAATAFWAAGDPVDFVVDLGEPQRIGGVRVSTHQPGADYCHPEQVEVALSADGRTWRQTGTIRHHDLWKPPGDYEPWEHDDDPSYDALPAGGRLAYSFPLVFNEPQSGRYVRFTCTPLVAKGMGISELEVLDRVDTAP